tara:strand:- start:46614 stop:47954 length:1341 start_codon:yes stop_codon:yes gene_type:complete
MTNSPSSWAGTDLTPLPYESLVSCLWRFAWRNKLDAKRLKNICTSQATYPKKDFFDNNYWFNQSIFLEKSTWKIPSADEQVFTFSLDLDNEIWVERKFRYCPLCLEHCYHSFWHQFLPLNLCPIHRIPLTTKCHCCCQTLPPYGFSKSLFDKPFYCVNCREPISGVRPELNLHLEFRYQAPLLSKTFMPYMNWWKQTLKLRLSAYELDPKLYYYASHTNTWCKNKAFIRSIVNKGLALPLLCTEPLYQNITTLQWKIKIFEDPPNHFLSVPRNSWSERVRIPTAVYKCTLRFLKKWICQYECWGESEFNDAFVGSLQSTIRECPKRLLALHAMRGQLENNGGQWRNFDISKLQLKDQPTVEIESWFNRTPRRAWFAVFLAIYVSWYYRILKSNHNQVDISLDHSYCDDTYLFLRSKIESIDQHNTWVGNVAFPELAGIEEIFNRRK